jgi:hypothetical protein
MTKKDVLVIVRFNLKPETTRSLTATQPGDSSQTRIIFGSTKGKLKRKDLKKEHSMPAESGTVAVQWTEFVAYIGRGVNVKKQQVTPGGPASVCLYFGPGSAGSYDKKKATPGPVPVFAFAGVNVASDLGAAEPDPTPIFFGTINAAAGKYQELFGAGAVLQYDTVSGEGILRIYGK